MILNLFKKKRYLVIADDGVNFWGIVVENNTVIASNYFKDDSNSNNAFEFGKNHGAKSVLFLSIKDVRELDIKLGIGLSRDERDTAIQYASASAVGARGAYQIISYIDGMLHDFRSGVLVSYFTQEEIDEFAQLAKDNKMIFFGITNFKQLFLIEHFSLAKQHNNVFLFLGKGSGFLAIPERNKLVVRNLPFGVVPVDIDNTQWWERATKRLVGLKGKFVSLYSPIVDETLHEKLKQHCEIEDIELKNWSESLNQAIEFFFTHKPKVIYVAQQPPKVKDPKVSGTYIGITLFVITFICMLFLVTKNYFVKVSFEKEFVRKDEIVKTVNKHREQLKQTKNMISTSLTILNMMKNKERISKDYLVVINLLSRYPLQYSKIIEITEKNTGIHIVGESVWQADFSKFFHHFEKELNHFGLSLQSEGIKEVNNNKIEFKAKIYKQ